MDNTRRAALTYVIGGGALPSVATAQGTKEASAPSSAADPNVGPQTPIEWFVAGVAVGILITVAWVKIRGGGGGQAASAT